MGENELTVGMEVLGKGRLLISLFPEHHITRSACALTRFFTGLGAFRYFLELFLQNSHKVRLLSDGGAFFGRYDVQSLRLDVF